MSRRPDGKVETAGCLIIGDEVLGGKVRCIHCSQRREKHWSNKHKTVDTNSAYFAKYCFDLGIALKRIEVIPDDEAEIIEASQRMSARYDFVVTSGGIGPTFVTNAWPLRSSLY